MDGYLYEKASMTFSQIILSPASRLVKVFLCESQTAILLQQVRSHFSRVADRVEVVLMLPLVVVITFEESDLSLGSEEAPFLIVWNETSVIPMSVGLVASDRINRGNSSLRGDETRHKYLVRWRQEMYLLSCVQKIFSYFGSVGGNMLDGHSPGRDVNEISVIELEPVLATARVFTVKPICLECFIAEPAVSCKIRSPRHFESSLCCFVVVLLLLLLVGWFVV